MTNYRGMLVGQEENDTVVRVLLVDTGRVVQVPWWNVGPLPDELAKTKALCFAVQLEGIVPAGSSQTEWSITAREQIKGILKEYKKDLFISSSAVSTVFLHDKNI